MHASIYNGRVKIDGNRYLLFNNLSGAMDIVKEGILNILDGKLKLKNSVTDYLIKQGYFTEKLEKEEEKEFVEKFSEMYEKSKKSKQHTIILTYDCNLRCKYCYEKNLRLKGEKWVKSTIDSKMIDKIYEVIDHFDSMGDNKSKAIVLYGGEPFLVRNKELVEYIMKKGTKRGRKFFVITNGTSLDQYMDLIEKYPIERIQVTIDGPKEVHDKRRFTKYGEGTFDKIVSNTDKLINSGFPVSIKVNIDMENYEEVPQLVEYFKELGWNKKENVKAFLGPVFSSAPKEGKKYPYYKEMETIFGSFANDNLGQMWSEGLNDYSPLEEIFKHGQWKPRYAFCEAHRSLLFYDPFGNIYPCWEAVGNEDIIVGKYYPNFELNGNYEKWMNRTVFNLEKCKRCPYSLLCGGGCAYHTYLKTGTIEKEDCSSMNFALNKYIPTLIKRHKI